MAANLAEELIHGRETVQTFERPTWKFNKLKAITAVLNELPKICDKICFDLFIFRRIIAQYSNYNPGIPLSNSW